MQNYSHTLHPADCSGTSHTLHLADCSGTSRALHPADCSGTSRALNSFRLHQLLRELSSPYAAPVILCIGTDRIIGDCLGPMVGSMLTKAAGTKLDVYGTLEQTVHALNLPQINDAIKKKHHGQIIIAIDASLGSFDHIGSVFIRPGALHPGAGVQKSLPGVGDIAITGITNNESSSPYLDLQTARLSTISKMAEKICGCILEACVAYGP